MGHEIRSLGYEVRSVGHEGRSVGYEGRSFPQLNNTAVGLGIEGELRRAAIRTRLLLLSCRQIRGVAFLCHNKSTGCGPGSQAATPAILCASNIDIHSKVPDEQPWKKVAK